MVEIVLDVKKFDSVFRLNTKAVRIKGDDKNKKEASLDLEAD